MDQNTRDVLFLTVPLAGSAFAAWISYRAKVSADGAREDVKVVAADVLRVEKATNSHTDLLVAATKAASHAEGKEEERVEQRGRDANMKGPAP